MTTLELKEEIQNVFGRIETSGYNQFDLEGQLSLKFDFENEKQYDKVIALLQEEYCHYNHNFELNNGVNVYVLTNL